MTPRPGPPGEGRVSGVRLKRTVDAAQLLMRGKLRRVERHWERSKRNGCEPRRDSEHGPSGSSEPTGKVSRRKRHGSALGCDRTATRSPVPSPASADGEVRPAARLERPETWRTPGSAAGCNKPAKCQVEQTVEVGRNGKDGTCSGRGSPGPKVAPRRQADSFGKTHGGSSSEQRRHREWTPGAHVDGGAIFDNPMRGVRRPHGRETSGREARRRAHHGRRTAQAGLSLRRRSEVHEGRAVWSTRPQGAREREVPRSPASSSHTKSMEGQGGRVEKANDPRPAHALATPRCDPGRSGEEVNDPEGHADSREAAKAHG